MQRLNDTAIVLTQEELDNIRDFIDNALESDWDHYTNTFICTDSWEDGKRRMNPQMYDLAQKMMTL